MAYAVTLAGHPAVSLPVGLDRNGMPFGLQIVGPRGGDAFVLSVAAALEAMLASDRAHGAPGARSGETARGAAAGRGAGVHGVRLTPARRRPASVHLHDRGLRVVVADQPAAERAMELLDPGESLAQFLDPSACAPRAAGC